jgi:hypothetical protein
VAKEGQIAHTVFVWKCDQCKAKVWNKDRDWPFAFLAMWVSVVLATALLALRYVFKFTQTSLTAPRFTWRPKQRKRPANQASARRAK